MKSITRSDSLIHRRVLLARPRLGRLLKHSVRRSAWMTPWALRRRPPGKGGLPRAPRRYQSGPPHIPRMPAALVRAGAEEHQQSRRSASMPMVVGAEHSDAFSWLAWRCQSAASGMVSTVPMRPLPAASYVLQVGRPRFIAPQLCFLYVRHASGHGVTPWRECGITKSTGRARVSASRSPGMRSARTDGDVSSPRARARTWASAAYACSTGGGTRCDAGFRTRATCSRLPFLPDFVSTISQKKPRRRRTLLVTRRRASTRRGRNRNVNKANVVAILYTTCRSTRTKCATSVFECHFTSNTPRRLHAHRAHSLRRPHAGAAAFSGVT